MPWLSTFRLFWLFSSRCPPRPWPLHARLRPCQRGSVASAGTRRLLTCALTMIGCGELSPSAVQRSEVQVATERIQYIKSNNSRTNRRLFYFSTGHSIIDRPGCPHGPRRPARFESHGSHALETGGCGCDVAGQPGFLVRPGHQVCKLQGEISTGVSELVRGVASFCWEHQAPNNGRDGCTAHGAVGGCRRTSSSLQPGITRVRVDGR